MEASPIPAMRGRDRRSPNRDPDMVARVVAPPGVNVAPITNRINGEYRLRIDPSYWSICCVQFRCRLSGRFCPMLRAPSAGDRLKDEMRPEIPAARHALGSLRQHTAVIQTAVDQSVDESAQLLPSSFNAPAAAHPRKSRRGRDNFAYELVLRVCSVVAFSLVLAYV